MENAGPARAGDWMIHPGDQAPFVYDPRVHSPAYVWALSERYSPDVAQDILRQAAELNRRARAMGYDLAVEQHGLDEVLSTEEMEELPLDQLR